ncbi:hypothetical protein LguiA_014841 [Lonicera macranthoides]
MLSSVASKGPMVMVSEGQSGNHNDSSLQSLQFPTMTVTQNIATKKLRIKITSKKTEAGPEKKFVIQSYDDPNIYADDDSKVRLPMQGSNKHGPPAMVDLQKEKRQKMDRTVKQQCGNILKTLMTHPAGWVFNKPVDPVALGIPDYFSIISEPMDLGTIKSKLDRNLYFTVEEFAADVRLTFSNAMVYNPPSNGVHLMAKELDNIFSRRWKNLEVKLNRDIKRVEHGCLPKDCLDARPAKLRHSDDNCLGLARPDAMWVLLLKVKPSPFTSTLGPKSLPICIDLTPAEPAETSEKGRRPLLGKVILKGTVSGNRSACGSANTKQSLKLVNSKCRSCNSTTCQCSIKHDSASASSSDLSSERSLAQDLGASKAHEGGIKSDDYENRGGSEVKNMLTSCARKSDQDFDGAVSAFDEENISSSLPPSTPTSTAPATVGGWSEPIDVQLSPKKALRAAMLKTRFAGTILKAKQKTLLDQGDKVDPVKMQQEQERLERQQQEEKARIEAQIRAAEAASRSRAEAELKMQREREREAARVALEKMEKTVEFDNLAILKEIERLRKCPQSERVLKDEEEDDGSPHQVVLDLGECLLSGGNPLERLGLFIKQEEEEDFFMEEDDDVEEEVLLDGDGEEGEIFS